MKSRSPLVFFFAVFLGIVCGGGLLLFGWDHFIREKSAKPYTLPISVTAVLPAESAFERKGMLDGEVFIVTKGGQNYKLGLVSVALYPLSTVKEYVDQKDTDSLAELTRLSPLVDAAGAEMKRLETASDKARELYFNHLIDLPQRASLEANSQRARDRYYEARRVYSDLLESGGKVSSGDYYFSELPQPITATQTNSDGRFQIEMSTKGDFVIAAQAHRTVGDSVERYYWLLKVSLDGSQSKTIMLSNNNLSSEVSPDQLIHTK